MRYAIVTLGCRVNQADSLALDAALRAGGAHSAAPEHADVVVVNSCSVTATADQGTRQAVRRIARDKPDAHIVVTGCYATREPAAVAALPGVQLVVPNDCKEHLAAEILKRCDADATFGEITTAARYAGGGGPCGAASAASYEPGALGRTAFTLRVQTGCDERCSYCIIPSTRGRSQSAVASDVVRQLQIAEAAGYREVTLTGVHLGAYGRDLSTPSSLFELLDRVLDSTTLVFRLGSLEPMDCTPDIVDLVSGTDRIAPALHLPMQHASDDVLAAMRRPYTCAGYDTVVTAIRDRIPHAALGSDIIVGFPGETDADADRLIEYLVSSPLTQLHVFPYSDRPGTESTGMAGRVHGTTVRERGRRVREIGRDLADSFRERQVGSIRPALVIEDGSMVSTDNGLRARLLRSRARNERLPVRLYRNAPPLEPDLAGESDVEPAILT
jgi:threonylcarbamoyladenosine tRNA methylthiotransferase MtaB